MMKNLLRAGGMLALAGAAACSADIAPVAPTMSAGSASHSLSASRPMRPTLNPSLDVMNAQLTAAGSNVRVIKAELIRDGKAADNNSSDDIWANDRYRGIGAEWVPGDPRRGGQIGVTYNVTQFLQPATHDANGANPRLVPYDQLDAQIEESMSAWRGQSCAAPITRVPITEYSDITQYGWYPLDFFESLGPGGDNIIGVTFSSIFINPDGSPTDIDHNKKADLAGAAILYNTGFWWGTTQALNVVDFYSIITHETGHSLGLGHFGKVFVTKHSEADGSITLDDIKYAPKAMMNAVYVTGRSEIAGTDHSSFCQIWSHVK